MKKFLAILLACAMFLPLLASCGSLQAGELDVEAYALSGNQTQNVASKVTRPDGFTGYTGATSVNTKGDEYDPDTNPDGTYDTYMGTAEEAAIAGSSSWIVAALAEATKDGGSKVVTIETAAQFYSFLVSLSEAKSCSAGDNPIDSTKTSIPKHDWNGVTVKLARDLVLNTADAPHAKQGTHISGDGTRYFNGIFDGQNHVVSGWYQAPTHNNRSMFGPLYNATVKDVAFINCDMDAYYESDESGSYHKRWSFLSVLAAGEVTVDKVYIQGVSEGGASNSGGMFGEIKSNATVTISNSKVDVVIGGEHAPEGSGYGGMIGQVGNANVAISNCEVICDITIEKSYFNAKSTEMYDANGDKVADVDANGDTMLQITADNSNCGNIGGMIGNCPSISGGRVLSISGCVVSGTIVSGGANVGGVVGRVNTSSVNTSEEEGAEANFRIKNTVSNVDITIEVARSGYTVPADTIYVTSSGTAVDLNAKINSFTKQHGGIIGFRESSGDMLLENCVNNGNITTDGNGQLGGIIGAKGNTTSSGKSVRIVNCVNTGDMTLAKSGADVVGGLIGYVTQGPMTIIGGSNSGAISGDVAVSGGIGCVGGAAGNAITIEGYTNNGSINGSVRVGGIVGSKGNNASGFANLFALTIDGCINNGPVTAKNNDSNVAGIIGYVGGGNNANNTNKLTIEDCINNAEINGKNNTGGIVGLITRLAYTDKYYMPASEVEISGCTNNGAVNGATYVAGIAARPSDSLNNTFSVTISSCVNNGDIYGSGNQIAGVVAEFLGAYDTDPTDDKAPALAITDCINTGDILSKADTTAETGKWSGGIAGYIHNDKTKPIASVTISGCSSSGKVLLGRSSGGLLGYIQHAFSATVENCSVSADMEFYHNSSSNPHCGGLLGQICESGATTISNCSVTGSMYIEDNKGASFLCGGLAGQLRNTANNGYFNSTNITLDETTTAYATASVTNCTVRVDFKKPVGTSGSDTNDKLEVMIGSISPAPDPENKDYVMTMSDLKYVRVDANIYSNGTQFYATVANTPLYNATSAPDGVLTEISAATAKFVGSQYKDNGDGTYALRYVFGVNDLTDADKALGFNVNINFIEGQTVTEKNITVYCPTLYTSIVGGGTTYTAAANGVQYLFTLTINGIPEDQIKLVAPDNNAANIKAYINNASVILNAFVGTKEIVSATKTISVPEDNNVHTFKPDNFSGTLPSEFTGNGLFPEIDYYAPFEANTSAASYEAGCYTVYKVSTEQAFITKTCTSTDANHTCAFDDGTNQHTGFNFNGVVVYRADGVTTAPYHFYPEGGRWEAETGDKEGPNVYNEAYAVKVNVDKAGIYDLCLRVRMQTSATTRTVMLQVNDQAYNDQTMLKFVTDADDYENYILAANLKKTIEVDAEQVANPNYLDSYITGFSVYLEEGENTLTFRAPYRGGAFMHVRDVYVTDGTPTSINYSDSDFLATMPEDVANESGTNTVITIAGSGCEAGSALTVQSNNANAYDMVCWNDTGAASAHGAIRLKANNINHYYINKSSAGNKDALGVTAGDKSYIRWSFTVEEGEAGDYELYFNLRLKDSTTRFANIQLDNQPSYSQYALEMSFETEFGDKTADVAMRDAVQNSYLATGITFKDLAEGTHTITVTLPEGSNSSFHFRNLYLVKKN